jgi:hypothetical protein
MLQNLNWIISENYIRSQFKITRVVVVKQDYGVRGLYASIST